MLLLLSALTYTGKAQSITPEEAALKIGDTVTVCGKIMDAKYMERSKNQPTLLNMGNTYPNQKLTVVIYGESRKNFGYKPEDMLLNKTICITGKVEVYNGKSQMVVTNPFQIKIAN